MSKHYIPSLSAYLVIDLRGFLCALLGRLPFPLSRLVVLAQLCISLCCCWHHLNLRMELVAPTVCVVAVVDARVVIVVQLTSLRERKY